MKYEDLDSYIEDLFQRPESHQVGDLPSFDDRLTNVEQAILDAYESAMRWHSAQIAPGDDHSHSEHETSASTESSALGYEYWSEETSLSPRRFSAALPAPSLSRSSAGASGDLTLDEPESRGLTCGEILVIALALLGVFLFMVIAS
jgi:hypothetical protein